LKISDIEGDCFDYPEKIIAKEPYKNYSVWKAMIESAFSSELADKYIGCGHIWWENGIAYTDGHITPEIVSYEAFDKYELLYNENGKAAVKTYGYGDYGCEFVYTTEFTYDDAYDHDRWIISAQDIDKNFILKDSEDAVSSVISQLRERIKNSTRENEYGNGGYYIDGIPQIKDIIADNDIMTVFGVRYGDFSSGFGIYMKKENKTVYKEANYVTAALYDGFICFDTEYVEDDFG
jgi:hypothetical protein